MNRGRKCLKQMNTEQAHGYVRQRILTPYTVYHMGFVKVTPKPC